jgi:hypothetical protein
MAMGTRRRRRRQERLWVGHQELAQGPAHPFYDRVNELLEAEQFDEFAEKECAKFYAENNGRPSLTPGIYFRLLLTTQPRMTVEVLRGPRMQHRRETIFGECSAYRVCASALQASAPPRQACLPR